MKRPDLLAVDAGGSKIEAAVLAKDGSLLGAARMDHREHDTGSIEVGKRADLAVLDRNVFAHPVGEIADVRCLETYVDGDRVYAAADA